MKLQKMKSYILNPNSNCLTKIHITSKYQVTKITVAVDEFSLM